jgi:DNA segregation ATPase FtsK/SpoIIIE-like protein
MVEVVVETDADASIDDMGSEPEFRAELEAPAAAAPIALAQPHSAVPPPPSWEQTALFEEEPVDAYGTPLSLVETLRKSDDVSNDDAPVAAPASAESDATDDARDPVAAASTRFDFDGVDLDDDAEVESLRVMTAAAEPAVAESSPPLTAPSSTVKGHVAAPSLFDEPAQDEDDEAPVAAAEPEIDEDLDDEAVDEEGEEEGEDEASDAPLFATVSDEAQDEVEEAETESEDRGDEPIDQLDDEPTADEAEAPVPAHEVVLQPQAAPVARRPGKLRVDEQVFLAGCLFVERQRVAVSMLQREFGLDFKSATEILDQLQKSGLIGPYLGGQRRDILLTLDQWKEKVGAA